MKKFSPVSAIFLAILALSSLNACAEPKNKPHVQQIFDLAKLARQSHDKKLPILLLFSATDCPYCDLLENEILNPMLLSGDYQDRVIIAKVVIDNPGNMHDFNGKPTSIDHFKSRYSLFVTPTLLFLDARGTEINHRIVGVNTIEMFGGRVDTAIANALKRLRPDNHVARNNTKKKI